MNRGLEKLQPYPFERLKGIRDEVAPAPDLPLINLSIGEPQHPTPDCIVDALIEALGGTAKYPATRGLPELREAICSWLGRRFRLANGLLDPDRHVLPVNGTREALFSIAQAVIDSSCDATVAMPNPFYQIYEGATLLAGAQPYYLPIADDSSSTPDWHAINEADWARMQMIYVCSPANPSGSVMTAEDYEFLLERADQHDFIVVADECYSELYFDETKPPLGLLQWCAQTGRDDFSRCVVMHSLSKRSNAPGLRSGFVAGDAGVLSDFFRYRTYQGGAMPIHVQYASIAAWSDESHVEANRAAYREKFEVFINAMDGLWDLRPPEAGFYLWPDIGSDDVGACRRLLGERAVLVLPGRFLGRDTATGNPGASHLRIALVAPPELCEQAGQRIRTLFG
ncbi:MAG: succinyldiaminopimelate transaminase [Gammaproteobacteria bacterium]